ncbi:MAG: VOC family protein [Candidatus Wallbacteria bacterium]|nr:VOC family protein [Candidatus Wallbacteria bacterium]
MTRPIPEGFHTLTPHLIVRDTRKAIDFYKRAFGAKEIGCHLMPDGKTVMHAELRIGDSPLMLAEENPQWKCASPLTLNGSPVTIHVYVTDVDASYNQAVAAGATVKMPPENMFWGDRFAQVSDPFGHVWSIATHVEDLTEAQVEEKAKALFAK